MSKHLHIIGIGGIGISALARYYHSLGYRITGSDQTESSLIVTLRAEGIEVTIGHTMSAITPDTDLVIYSEAIITKPDFPKDQQIYSNPELAQAKNLHIPHLSYPEALAEVVNSKKCIAIAGSHGKSTTTAMTALIFVGSPLGANVIIGTQVPQLGNSNFHAEDSEYFVIEACEYRRAFLRYKPYITVITNIDLDHLDYYKNLDDYISAFQSLVDQTEKYVVISADDENSAHLQIPEEKKVIVGNGTMQYNCGADVCKVFSLPPILLQIPGRHIQKDAYLSYAVGKLLDLEDEFMVNRLQSYNGSWRRSEIVRTTYHGNILMSDYGHHPNEIIPTLSALREKYPDRKLYVVFQPHQYSRTRELLPAFATAFDAADMLVVPDIYFSRDKKEDVEYMTVERFIEAVRPYQPHILDGK